MVQVSSIYAHQGLMNSIGHRKNILNDTFKILGVGVLILMMKNNLLDRKLYWLMFLA